MTVFANNFDSWDYVAESDRSFNRITRRIAIPFLILGLIVPFWQISGLEEGGGDTLEQRFVTLQEDAEPAAKVEEPKPEPEPVPEEKPEPEPEKKVEPEKKPEPEPKPEPKVEKPVPLPKPEPTAEQKAEAARRVAEKSGVLAMSDQLAALRDSSTLSGFDSNRRLASGDVLAAKSGTGASGNATQAFSDAAGRTSGGVSGNNSTAARKAQSGTGLDSRRATVKESPIGFGEDKTKPGQDGDKLIAGRTLEEIQSKFDQSKGAFYVIYNRAQRENPNIGAGKIVVSITIAPDGRVTDCKLVSSTFGDPAFEAKVIERVKLINFGPKQVPPFTYPNYPINFLPT